MTVDNYNQHYLLVAHHTISGYIHFGPVINAWMFICYWNTYTFF